MNRRLAVSLAAVVAAFVAADCRAIEMFTFFGDGSRIGLPSLEVPVEAYPGIPLRSDRLRARRRGARPSTARPAGAMPGTITLRAAPTPSSVPAAAGRTSMPVAPEPPAPAAH